MQTRNATTRNAIIALTFSILLLVATSRANDGKPKVKTFTCGSTFQKPRYATVEDFVEALESRRDPWPELLMPDDFPSDEQAEDFAKPLLGKVHVVQHSASSAIVFVDNKSSRTAPFSAVIFLLEKKRGQFHVTDFIRRATGYEGYSDVSEPTILDLRPRQFIHFYFTEFLGGRKWDFDTDEFYIVRHGHFQRTLTLKNVSAFCSPVAPYREFGQNAEVTVSDGRPCFTIERTWSMDDRDDQKQEFAVTFRWNSQIQKFTSPNAGRITLKPPVPWSSGGLPAPPGSRP